VPVLKVDGTMYCQSKAIEGFAAKHSGFPVLTDMEELANQSVVWTVQEVFDKAVVGAWLAMQPIPVTGKNS